MLVFFPVRITALIPSVHTYRLRSLLFSQSVCEFDYGLKYTDLPDIPTVTTYRKLTNRSLLTHLIVTLDEVVLARDALDRFFGFASFQFALFLFTYRAGELHV